MKQGVDCGKQRDMLSRFIFKKGLAAQSQGMRSATSSFQFLHSLAQLQRATLLQVLPFLHLVTEWDQLHAAAEVTPVHMGSKKYKQSNSELREFINDCYYFKTLHFWGWFVIQQQIEKLASGVACNLNKMQKHMVLALRLGSRLGIGRVSRRLLVEAERSLW